MTDLRDDIEQIIWDSDGPDDAANKIAELIGQRLRNADDFEAMLRRVVHRLRQTTDPKAISVRDQAADLLRRKGTASPLRSEEDQRGPAAAMRHMQTAPRDGTPILAKTTPNHQHWPARWFVVSHAGQTESGLDLGWNLFPGWGGLDDKTFEGWVQLSTASEAALIAEGRRKGLEEAASLIERYRRKHWMQKGFEAYAAVLRTAEEEIRALMEKGE